MVKLIFFVDKQETYLSVFSHCRCSPRPFHSRFANLLQQVFILPAAVGVHKAKTL